MFELYVYVLFGWIYYIGDEDLEILCWYWGIFYKELIWFILVKLVNLKKIWKVLWIMLRDLSSFLW